MNIEDFKDDHFEVKEEFNDNHHDLHLFNQFDHPIQEHQFVDFEFDHKASFDRLPYNDDRSLLSRPEAPRGEVKKSISFTHIKDAVKYGGGGFLTKTESCINLHELSHLHSSMFIKKPNSKNVFIQKIRSLLSDTTLRGKLETDK